MEHNLWERKRKEKIKSVIEGVCVQKLIWLHNQVLVLQGTETCFKLDLGRHIILNSSCMRYSHIKRKTQKTKGP